MKEEPNARFSGAGHLVTGEDLAGAFPGRSISLEIALKRWSLYQDAAVNILGFIPLGFSFALWLLRFTRLPSPGAGAATLLLGALLSPGIEWTQAYLPTRDSSAGDLIFDILGTLVGIMLLLLKARSGRIILPCR